MPVVDAALVASKMQGMVQLVVPVAVRLLLVLVVAGARFGLELDAGPSSELLV